MMYWMIASLSQEGSLRQACSQSRRFPLQKWETMVVVAAWDICSEKSAPEE